MKNKKVLSVGSLALAITFAVTFTATMLTGAKAPESGLTGSKEKPQITRRLENKTPVETKMENENMRDSMKNEINKKNRMHKDDNINNTKLIPMGNGLYAMFPETVQPSLIFIVPAVKESKPRNFLFTEPVGLQLITADSYYSTGTGTETYQNGEMISSTFAASGPLDTVAAYRDRMDVYPSNGVTYTFPANFTNYAPYAPIKTNKEKFYFVMNMPNSATIAQEIRAFLASKGEPAAIYNAGMFIHAGMSGQNSKWFIAIWADYDINGNITNARGPPVLVLRGFDDADILLGAFNWAYTCTGLIGPNNVIYNNGNGNYKLGMVRATTGARNEQRLAIKTGFIAWETYIGINQISTEIPSSYSLSQNYPNPFNSQTKIKFAVLKAGMVRLKVYDALGKEVATLADKVMTAGIYEVSWNADRLTSGVYFYRMTAEEFTETRRMMLIR